MTKRHVHAEMLMQYAMNPGLIVEIKDAGVWVEISGPSWVESCEYRFKPGQEVPPKIGEECLFWNNGDKDTYKDSLIGYSPKGYLESDGPAWDNCKPIPKIKTYVKKAWEIVKWLEENGYEYMATFGWWKHPAKLTFPTKMFQYCGKEKPNEWDWLPEWLEEREEV